MKALAACGLERHGCGYKIDMHKLFLDWAEVTRKLGKTPSMLDYEMHGEYTTKALVKELRRLNPRASWTAGLCQRGTTGKRLAGCNGDCRGRTEGGTASGTDVGEEKSDRLEDESQPTCRFMGLR